MSGCIEESGSIKRSRKCQYVQFPHHPMRSFHQPCGTTLLRTTFQHQHSKQQFKPHKVYAYQSIKDALTRLLKRKGFLDKCEHWRKRPTLPDYLGDVYDGEIWTEFQSFYHNSIVGVWLSTWIGFNHFHMFVIPLELFIWLCLISLKK